MKIMVKNIKQAFTLVELIVVITILAILWTIAFISLQWYASSARNSTRISDMWIIKKTLELYNLKEWKYPNTTNGKTVTYTWQIVWTQWIFWTKTIKETWKISKIPTDPLTGIEYTYSLLNTKQEYQIAWIFEWEVALNNTVQTNAVTKTATAKVTWTYNWLVTKVSTWSTVYVLALPSIISIEDWIWLSNIIQNNKLVFNWYRNLPANYSNSEYTITWALKNTNFKLVNITWNDSDFVVYSWSLELLSKTNQTWINTRTELITNLQNSYSWTSIENLSSIAKLTNVDLTDNTAVNNLWTTITHNYLGVNITEKSKWTFTCWDNISALWETYTTIKWADWNCWTSQNMRHWTKLATWSIIPSDDNIIQKWCYNNEDTNCTNQWGLYTWYEAMWYWTSDNEDTNKSVCGQLWDWWKLPTDTQWQNLVDSWATWWTWNKLSWIISTLPGVLNGKFRDNGWYGIRFSSSAGNNSDYSTDVFVPGGNNDITIYWDNKSLWLSIVCIKN